MSPSVTGFDRMPVPMLAPLSAQFDVQRLVPAALARVIANQRQQKTAVIAGVNDQGRRLAERISANQWLGIRFAGYFEDRRDVRLNGVDRTEVLGPLRQLAGFVKSQRVDVIYLALPMSSHPRIRRLLDDLHDTTASLYFVPDVLMFELIQAHVDTIGGIPVVAVCESPF
jgi:putative colanic acid biosynthesis UDP-glucose lipid carrier transferase